MSLTDYRKEFPVTETLIYLNHAGVSPTSTRARDAVAEWFDGCVKRGILDEEGDGVDEFGGEGCEGCEGEGH